MCEARRLLERVLNLSTQVVQDLRGRRCITADELAGELDVDGERDEPLLQAVVQLTLERPAIRVVGAGLAVSRCANVVDLEAQPIERLLRRLEVRKLRSGTSLLALPGSCP
jgi:hypothetical protein